MNYTAVTHDIEVTARPIFERRQSVPFTPVYTWSYEIQITNRSERVVQLLYRYWKISDAAGGVKEVRGAGVIGQHP
ncbi:MAG TPA: ApaG domain, partial [Oligoflexia bacterium]|nr:ApaG domain [Oligoflexia bacterium]